MTDSENRWRALHDELAHEETEVARRRKRVEAMQEDDALRRALEMSPEEMAEEIAYQKGVIERVDAHIAHLRQRIDRGSR